MIAINGIDHVGIRVADFNRSVSFYRNFGFEVTRKDLQEHVLVLRHQHGTLLNLLDFVDRDVKEHNVLMDEKVKYAGYTHIALQVADIQRVISFLTELDITITEGPVTFGDGKTSVFIRDPDRNVIEFTQPPLVNEIHKEETL